MDVFFMISSTGTASSNSKVRTRAKRSAFILFRCLVNGANEKRGIEKTDSTRAKRKPIHDLAPPRKVIMLPQTPGSAVSTEPFTQRSGLQTQIVST